MAFCPQTFQLKSSVYYIFHICLFIAHAVIFGFIILIWDDAGSRSSLCMFSPLYCQFISAAFRHASRRLVFKHSQCMYINPVMWKAIGVMLWQFAVLWSRMFLLRGYHPGLLLWSFRFSICCLGNGYLWTSVLTSATVVIWSKFQIAVAFLQLLLKLSVAIHLHVYIIAFMSEQLYLYCNWRALITFSRGQ